MDQRMGNNNGNTTRQVKAIFKITNMNPIEASKWGKEEYIKLIKGVQEHGQNWEALCSSLPTKTRIQIEEQGQRLIERIRYKNETPLEFIRSKAAESLIEYLEDIEGNEEKKVEPRNLSPRIEEVKASSDESEIHINPTNKQPIPSKPKKKKKAREEEVRMVNEEEKVSHEIIQPYPQLVPQMMVPYHVPDVMAQLHEIKSELGSVSESMATEKPNCKGLLDNDPHFKHYWDALEKCSTSLQNIVSDIYFIHVSSHQMRQQMMPPQFYYSTDQLRPRFMGPPFHHERPPGNGYQ